MARRVGGANTERPRLDQADVLAVRVPSSQDLLQRPDTAPHARVSSLQWFDGGAWMVAADRRSSRLFGLRSHGLSLFGCRIEVEERDGVAPEPVVAADHVDGAARHHEGGVTNLEDPSRVSEVQALGIPQLGGDPSDLLAATGLG